MRLIASFFVVCVVACGSPSSAQQQASAPATPVTAQSEPTPARPPVPLTELAPAAARPRAPSFAGGSAWLNAAQPLTMDGLRGHVVVVDFWTSCCINCLQTLPTLRALESHFSQDEVLVVGVQSPKFPNERRPERLAEFLQQYSIMHPVVIDAAMQIWDRWNVSAWPSIFVIDTEGRIAWADSGEPDMRELFGAVQSALDEGRNRHTLHAGPIAGVGPGARTDRPLAFPGKVTWLSDGGLAIADSAHHRVLVLDAQHRVRLTVGVKDRPGFGDGRASNAHFHFPQGLAEHAGALYVADVENHAVRRIELQDGTVSTVAGTGRLGRAPLASDWASARLALRSPWDVTFVGDRLFVALAGSHQIAEIAIENRQMRLFAGSGVEARVDGERLDAAFAQPSGLATDGRELFVLDSETSSVRAIDLRSNQVRTVVGQDLFVFGDVDGDRDTTRLQHPLGLTFDRGALFVADTYNAKIKRVDPRTGVTRTVWDASSAALTEPGGVASRAGVLAVANTDAHEVVLLGPEQRVERLAIVESASDSMAASDQNVQVRRPEQLTFEDVVVNRRAPVLRVSLVAPAGTELNREAPFSLVWAENQGLSRMPAALESSGGSVGNAISVPLALLNDVSAVTLRGVIDLVVCDAVTHRVCVPWTRRLEIQMRVRDDASESNASSSIVTLALPAAN